MLCKEKNSISNYKKHMKQDCHYVEMAHTARVWLKYLADNARPSVRITPPGGKVSIGGGKGV